MAEKKITIRPETKDDYRAVENLTREAFWNVYRPGCMEHYVRALLPARFIGRHGGAAFSDLPADFRRGVLYFRIFLYPISCPYLNRYLLRSDGTNIMPGINVTICINEKPKNTPTSTTVK